jgi:hypothetical protein
MPSSDGPLTLPTRASITPRRRRAMQPPRVEDIFVQGSSKDMRPPTPDLVSTAKLPELPARADVFMQGRPSTPPSTRPRAEQAHDVDTTPVKLEPLSPALRRSPRKTPRKQFPVSPRKSLRTSLVKSSLISPRKPLTRSPRKSPVKSPMKPGDYSGFKGRGRYARSSNR